MSDESERSPIFRWPSVVLMLLVAWGIVSAPASLESHRPTPENGTLPSGQTAAKVSAHLWEDPLAAVADVTKNSKESGVPDMTLKSPPKSSSERSDTYLIMPVLVTASPFDEGTEVRIRHRYAVLSALALAGFQPTDSQHLHYVSPKTDACGFNTPHRLIPYEWFEYDDNKNHKCVCVLWVGDDLLEECPLAKVQTLVDDLIGLLTPTIGERFPRVLPVLGPPDSGMLDVMVSEASRLLADCPRSLEKRHRITFHSTLTTSQESVAKYQKYSAEAEKHNELKRDSLFNVKLETGTDDELVDVLEAELKRRGLTAKDRMALLVEWDTEYGAGLVRALEKRFGGGQGANTNGKVQLYYYLRGLDGKLTEPSPAKEQVPQPTDSARLLRRSPQRPDLKASGLKQVDYLSRLVQENLHKDGGLRFIGILGSDVYDKILLMQAVRPIAPHAVFFTTDLDARLLDPSEYPSTHNLLIASHYDLNIKWKNTHRLQIPPFRDSYQTAVCRGCLIALHDADFLPNEWAMEPFDQPAPFLYEIGRSGRYLLSASSPEQPPIPPDDIAGWITRDGRTGFVLWALALVLTFTILLRPSYWRSVAHSVLRKRRPATHLPEDEPWNRRMRAIATTGVVFFVSLFLLIVVDARHPKLGHAHEPFFLFEGISTWPTEFLRLFVCVFSLYGTCAIMRSSERNAREISRDFGLRDDADHKSAHAKRRKHRFIVLDWLAPDRLWNWDGAGGRVDAVALWDDYRRDGSIGARVRRTLCLAVVYFVFARVLIVMLGQPTSPGRGTLNNCIDAIFIASSVFLLIWLVFFVFDATRLCDHFIRLLYRDETETKLEWPDNMRRDAAEKQGLDGPGVDCESLAHLITVRIVEQRTETVDKFIYWPAVALLVMFVSRYHVFDNWDWPPPLFIGYLICSSMLVYCAMIMRRDAERLRTHALKQMHDELGRVRASGSPPNVVQEDQILAMIQEVESANRGAFCRLADNPIIRAVLIPFGGMGTLAILDQLRPFL